MHLANKYLLSIYCVLSPDLGAGDSAANKLREGPFSNRIYRLMAIGDKGGSGLGLESHSPKLTYPSCGTHQMGAQKLFISVLLSGDLP